MSLTAREQLVVCLVEQQRQSFHAVARRVSTEPFPGLGCAKVSGERVRQIYAKVLRKRAAAAAAEQMASTWPWEQYAL